MGTHDRKVGIFVLAVVILGVESGIEILPSSVLAQTTQKGRIVRGILGKTREEPAKNQKSKRKTPYNVNIEFDKNDKACYVTISCGSLKEQTFYKERLNILRKLGYRLVPARELKPLFPKSLVEQMEKVPVLGKSIGTTDYRIHGPYLRWTELREVKGYKYKSLGYSVGNARKVYRSWDFKVYAFCDVGWDTKDNKKGKTDKIILANADTFWTSTIKESLGPLKLVLAFKKIVKNSAVSEELVQRVATMLSEYEDEQFVNILVKAMRNTDATVAQRAGTILGKLRDRRAIYPLIRLLRYQTPRPRAAAVLREITGQDFGQDYKEWHKWWWNHVRK